MTWRNDILDLLFIIVLLTYIGLGTLWFFQTLAGPLL